MQIEVALLFNGEEIDYDGYNRKMIKVDDDFDDKITVVWDTRDWGEIDRMKFVNYVSSPYKNKLKSLIPDFLKSDDEELPPFITESARIDMIIVDIDDNEYKTSSFYNAYGGAFEAATVALFELNLTDMIKENKINKPKSGGITIN